MNLPVCLVRISSPFVAAVNDIHHPTVIELRSDVDDVSVLSRPRSICQIAVEVHVQLRGSVANNPILLFCDNSITAVDTQ